MPHYYRLGEIPHKRHTQFRRPDGGLYHEELMGIHGFSGIKSLLYHRSPPGGSGAVSVSRWTWASGTHSARSIGVNSPTSATRHGDCRW